jgi:EAL domain-containing protein (putative c-di-GMP-specific phosphodiesterase class I)/GGDEF domain-containing protein
MQPPPTAILSGGLETSSGAGIAPMPGAPEPPDLAEAAPAEMTPVLLRLGSQLAGCPVYLVPPQPDEAAAATGLPLAGWWAERTVISPGGVVGTLRAIDIHGRPELAAVRSNVLDDLADLLANMHHLRSQLGRTDPVSGLPNRRQFLDDFAALRTRKTRPPDSLVMVALADPSRYAGVVRALGHDYAEAIIRTGVDTLRGLLPSGSGLYHVSPLGFVFFVPNCEQDLQDRVEAVVRALRGPIVCRGIPIDTHVGVGIVGLEGNVDAAEALRAAMAAAQDSRATRRGWAVYDRAADAAYRRAFTLLVDLRRAIEEEGQLSLNFQPRIDLRSGACAGAEALIRWTHPTFGPVSPGEFIPLAETTALISPLTDWVLDTAARHAAALGDAGHRVPLSVNVSPKNLAEPDFVDKLERVLERHRIAPDQLELEFTEGMLASDQNAVRHHLDRICAMGIDIAIDDFGSGYSNMSYLTQIPARILKIDQAFVRTMMQSAKNQHLVRTIIGMGQGLGYRVVAEGIETAEAFTTLAGWSCDEAQGYYISRPLPAEAFTDWLKVNRGGFVSR